MSLDEYLYGDVAPDQVDGWYPRFSGDVAPFVYWVPIKSIDIL